MVRRRPALPSEVVTLLNKRLLALFVIPVVIVLAGFVYSVAVVGGMESDITSQQNRISTLRQNVDSVNDRYNAVDAKVAAIEKDTGVRRDQLLADEKVISEFLSDTCVWSNFDEYTAARERAMSKWGLSEESMFLSKFMPKFEKAGPEAGKPDYNYVDALGLNMTVDGVTCYLSDIDADGTYHYFVEADLGSSSYGKHSSMRTLFVCGVTSDGKIVDADGVLLS